MKTYNDLFEYKELTPIHGKPTIDNLIIIFQQLKRNAQRIPTTLGGGLLGYLALILKPAVFNAIPNAAAFIRPTHPGVFHPTGPRLTASEVAEEKAAHEELLRTYNECNTVEQLLRHQLVKAVPNEYLDALRDDDTDMINDSIPNIINFLVKNYCKLSPQDFNTRESQVKNMIHSPDQHPNIIFNKIKQFQTLCQLIEKSRSDDQWVDMGYIIFTKSTAYKDALITWNAKDDADKTFVNFKTHIIQRYHALDQVDGLTIQDSSLNLVQTLTEHQDRLTSELKNEINHNMQVNFLEVVRNLQSYSDQEAPTPPLVATEPSLSANVVTNDTAILQLLKTMEAKINRLEASNATKTKNATTKDINPKTGRPFRRYCWTHGCCTHWGKDCTAKASGHQDDATFKERKGGSNKNCLPVV